MAARLASIARFSNVWIYRARLFYWSKAVGDSPQEGSWVADRDGIWSRGGVHVEELPDPFAPIVAAAGPSPPTPQPKPKRRRRRIMSSIRSPALLLVTLLWLIVTAPLSRALEPLDDPALLLLSQEGHADRPARRDQGSAGRSAKLDPLTPAAFVAIEDRRFYRHWGIDPRGDRPGDGRQHVAPAASARAAARSPSSSPRPASCRATAAQAQGAGSDHRLLARSVADQGGDPLALSVQRLFRRRRLWVARRGQALFRPRARSS